MYFHRVIGLYYTILLMKYQISLISDSTGETLDRIFLALKSQFSNFDYEKKEHVFIRMESQINKIVKDNEGNKNFIILYTVVETRLAKYISNLGFIQREIESSKNYSKNTTGQLLM